MKIVRFLFVFPLIGWSQSDEQVRAALQAGISFFHGEVASEGGYLYQYSADLKLQEGEGKFGRDVIEVQPPGTPAVGLAYVRAWTRTREPKAKAAALDAARVLIRGQLHSGGWNHQVLLDPKARGKQAYRVDGKPSRKARNISSFDDDQTSSAIRFLMQLDQALTFKNEEIHRVTTNALAAVLSAQFPNGGWPQVFTGPADPARYKPRRASLPDTWERTYTGHHSYWYQPTLNDNVMANVIGILFDAAEIYEEPRYRQAAVRGGEFLLLAQLPAPQAGWAQQYNEEMQPIWARKFEPPAISGGEARAVMDTLMDLFVATGEKRWLEPIPRALRYYESCRLPDGKLARFYELGSNRPLFFDREYRLTYKDDDLPTHYGFIISDWTGRVARRLAQIESESRSEVTKRPSAKEVQRVLAAQEARGAWEEEGRLRYHGKGDETRRIIRSETFVRHLDILSSWLGRQQKPPE